MSVTLLVVAFVMIAFLAWRSWRFVRLLRIREIVRQRRRSCQIVSFGYLVDGVLRRPVVLSLRHGVLHYETTLDDESLELDWAQEISYRRRLGSGRLVRSGTVLRLRCFEQTFEFILPGGSVRDWQKHIPARETPDPAHEIPQRRERYGAGEQPLAGAARS